MSRANPIVERARALRASLETDIASLEAQIAAKRAEAAVLDRLMLPTVAPAEKPPAAPTRRKRTTVREHDRNVPTPDPGPALPITQEPT